MPVIKMTKKAAVTLLSILLLLAVSLVLSRLSAVPEEILLPVPDRIEYGQPLTWKEVEQMFPKFTTAVLVDLETGRKLEVQRRGGLYHADIQPLSARDTRVMREIYEQWSWKRRAIVAEIGLYRVAASMNGMPHGSGKIQGNDFKGHFCLHFLGSRVHKSGQVDRAHQMMIWKAAGRPSEPFLKAGPEELINLVLTAIDQGDGGLAQLGLAAGEEADLWLAGQGLFNRLPRVSLKRITLQDRGDVKEIREYKVALDLFYPGVKGKIEKEGTILMKMELIQGRWLMEGESLRKLLEPE